ncbi:hypothetical protein MHM84_04980 [Halomonas sp. McH1-25]|uniref:hypothetical protein n=1 Tax=unclassified Halomonas TaxID=2609666 RepID=UPI001EF4A66F|nr:MULTISPECIES: hypothetical protein [unclassified Halomonas]MCG7599130.1 hypothetical protein [Halomonas sp. McH1-25]MCP1343598.1 hypothetical protein [Halomonas sp. FL8]MCP1361080.1 hypothetical protein [Halomonas sp. BBD45]
MLKPFVLVLLAFVAMPVLAAKDSLSLPADASVDVQVIDSITLDRASPERHAVLLRPVSRAQSSASHHLPTYCLITADAQLTDDRVRLTTQSVTCIEAEDSQPDIFSGELSAAAHERDGGFGLDVCRESQDGRCSLAMIVPDHTFQLNLGRALQLDAQRNPSAEINERRRHADERDEASGSEPASD